jgi:hypothetical protein
MFKAGILLVGTAAPRLWVARARTHYGDRALVIDFLGLVAAAALGWGLSLAVYGLVARILRWPMGALHVDFPALPVLIGLLALAFSLTFAAERGPASGGWVIVVFGALLAIFWIGFLRVGSQTSLLLAPLATVLLVIGWLVDPLR